MQEAFRKLAEQTILFLPRLGTGILILIAFWLSALVVGKIVRRLVRRNLVHRDVRSLLEKTVHYSIISFGLATAIGTMGINISALVAGLGLTGFALGFALKDILSNVLAGAMILFYRPFQTGNQVDAMNFSGEVVEINLRYVVLRGNGKKILIPNSTLLTNPITVFEEPFQFQKEP